MQGIVKNGVKILVVEDDDIQRESMAELLRLWGYQAWVASDGIKALKELSLSAFDLVVSDRISTCHR